MGKNRYPTYYPDLRDSLDKIADKLLTAKQNGFGLYCDMKGLVILGAPNGLSKIEIICSDDVNSVDDVYVAITGLTVEEYQNKRREMSENARISNEQRKARMEAFDKEIIDKIPEILDKGSEMVLPELVGEWQVLVEINGKTEFGRLYINSVYELLVALGEGRSISDCLQLFDDLALDGVGAKRVKEAVFKFSPRGLEFYKNVSTTKELLTDFKKILARVKTDTQREQRTTTIVSK